MPRRAVLVPVVLLASLSVVGLADPSAASSPASARTAVTAAVSGAASAARTVAAPTAADRRIAAMLSARATVARFGTQYSGTVIDVASNRVVWSYKGRVPRRPASTTKLVTATNALSLYGPGYRFTTTVKRSGASSALYLVGAGDPSLSGTDLAALADQTIAQLKLGSVRTVRVYADDHLFARPSLADGWKAGYVPADVRWVRALVVNGHHAQDTSLDAAAAFAQKLTNRGLKVSTVGRAIAVKGAPVIAKVQGDTLASIVQQMMLVSDNDHAEALHRLVARKAGYSTSWLGARQAQRVVLARDGVLLPVATLRDGSGLSRLDRLTSTQLARVVDNILESQQDDLAVLRNGALPVAGRTGTLAHRFATPQSRCAVGRVVAKTGTLSDTVTLAGYTYGTDGRLKAFAFMVDGLAPSATLRGRVDMLAATVNGCY
ncbi:D-alanyl-D-alanine carboxypeptidase/D-alanyl-D-alanine endopeptidase [Angustibacter sp. McL0619]|uniref:D-alanyl-D-alanine carboxypeptidase/D-alanyl-D-alanine endopeptidase n=1 Tax=Angustibacter sp. McL0619 TaxID=3415676 RepID=UPI003CF8F91F